MMHKIIITTAVLFVASMIVIVAIDAIKHTIHYIKSKW